MTNWNLEISNHRYGKKKSPVSSLSARRHFAMKRCPIVAKIAGSNQILSCCVLKRLFHIGYERLPDLWSLSKPLYFVYGKCGPHVIHVSLISLLAKKGASSHRFLSWLMTRNRRLFFCPFFLNVNQWWDLVSKFIFIYKTFMHGFKKGNFYKISTLWILSL